MPGRSCGDEVLYFVNSVVAGSLEEELKNFNFVTFCVEDWGETCFQSYMVDLMFGTVLAKSQLTRGSL